MDVLIPSPTGVRTAGDYARLIAPVSKRYDDLSVEQVRHLDDLLADLQNAQQLTVRCLFCEWQTTGTAGQAIRDAKKHRKTKHPGTPVKSGKRKMDAGKPMWQQAQEDREAGKQRDTSGLGA